MAAAAARMLLRRTATTPPLLLLRRPPVCSVRRTATAAGPRPGNATSHDGHDHDNNHGHDHDHDHDHSHGQGHCHSHAHSHGQDADHAHGLHLDHSHGKDADHAQSLHLDHGLGQNHRKPDRGEPGGSQPKQRGGATATLDLGPSTGDDGADAAGHAHWHGLGGHAHSHGTSMHQLLQTAGRDAARITWVGVGINIALTVSKAAGGIVFRSESLLADATHSFSDLVSDIITLVGVHRSRRPADVNYPYGYGRYEV